MHQQVEDNATLEGDRWNCVYSDSVGEAYDNAMVETFFATLEKELLSQGPFKSQAKARTATFRFLGYDPH